MDASLVNESAVLPPSTSIRLRVLPRYNSSLDHSAQGRSTFSRDGAREVPIVTVGDVLASTFIWHNVKRMNLPYNLVGWDLPHHAGHIDDTDYEGEVILDANYDDFTYSRA